MQDSMFVGPDVCWLTIMVAIRHKFQMQHRLRRAAVKRNPHLRSKAHPVLRGVAQRSGPGRRSATLWEWPFFSNTVIAARALFSRRPIILSRHTTHQ